MQTTTLVVIVNYRTADLVVDCLLSLQEEVAAVGGRFGPVKVVVADNASGDGSADRIEEAIASRGWAAWAQLRRLPRNGGFAWGNNAAIRHATENGGPPQYVWLLNPDTVVRPGALAALLEFMESSPRAGLAGSRLEDPDGTVQRSAFRFPSLPGEIDNGLRLGLATRLLSRRVVAPEPPGEATRTDWLSGASLLIRWTVIEQIGLLDEGYFMYFEETDFCRRASKAGWPCWYVPRSRVVHLVGRASGMNPQQQNKRRADYWFQSRRRYFLKHLGKIRTAAADGLFMIGFAAWRIRRRLQRKPDQDPVQFLADFARWSVWRRGFRLGG